MSLAGIITAIEAIATLVRNPALGGGGTKSSETQALLQHLAALIKGGDKTRQELRDWSDEIAQMAETGHQVSPRDFARWEGRLNAATVDIAEARERLEEAGALEPKGEETSDPVEGDDLKKADEAVVHEVGDKPLNEPQ